MPMYKWFSYEANLIIWLENLFQELEGSTSKDVPKKVSIDAGHTSSSPIPVAPSSRDAINSPPSISVSDSGHDSDVPAEVVKLPAVGGSGGSDDDSSSDDDEEEETSGKIVTKAGVEVFVFCCLKK